MIGENTILGLSHGNGTSHLQPPQTDQLFAWSDPPVYTEMHGIEGNESPILAIR